MQGQVMQMLMSQLKMKNPQMFQMIEQAQRNQRNPMEMFKQITNKYSPEQMNNFYSQIERMGFSPDLIKQVKGINTK